MREDERRPRQIVSLEKMRNIITDTTQMSLLSAIWPFAKITISFASNISLDQQHHLQCHNCKLATQQRLIPIPHDTASETTRSMI